MIYVMGAAVVWCIVLLLLAIFRWDWLSRHPRLYLDRFGRWRGAEYDSNIRIKTIIKLCIILGLVGVVTAVIANNYRNIQKLADYIQANAGEALPLAGGELVFDGRVEGNEIVIVRNNAATGLFGNYIVSADTHDYEEALVAFTGIFTNTTDQTLVVSSKDIKMSGIPTDTGHGYIFKGFWMADHKTDRDGNMQLAPGESAFLYFWAVLNKDEKTYPYAYVVQDGEYFYRLNMDSLKPVAAGELAAQNTYAAIWETIEEARDLDFGETYHGEYIGDVTLTDAWLKDGSMVWDGAPQYLDLVMKVESPNQLWDTTLKQWMTVLTVTDDGPCWEEAGFDIRERKDPVNEGENYSCEVHYIVSVPENADTLLIILSMGGDNYIMTASLEE